MAFRSTGVKGVVLRFMDFLLADPPEVHARHFAGVGDALMRQPYPRHQPLLPILAVQRPGQVVRGPGRSHLAEVLEGVGEIFGVLHGFSLWFSTNDPGTSKPNIEPISIARSCAGVAPMSRLNFSGSMSGAGQYPCSPA